MRSIAIINQKGGVGKTTTAVNLSAALAEAGQRVCLIDLDPQAHASLHLGFVVEENQMSMYDVLTDQARLDAVRFQVDDNLWLAPAHIDLAAAEMELAGEVGREIILRDRIREDVESSQDSNFDFYIFRLSPFAGRAHAKCTDHGGRSFLAAPAAFSRAARAEQIASYRRIGRAAIEPGAGLVQCRVLHVRQRNPSGRRSR